jgi:hypothetical protein
MDLETARRRRVAALQGASRFRPRLHVLVNQRDQLEGFENIILRSLGWSAAKGTIAALRLADDVPGAGQGFGLF